ncbi:MAG: HupE/UreJ family protein [Burkholderiaceae bacterium]
MTTGLLRHALIAVLAIVLATPVCAHEMTMAEIELRETAPGDFLWHWTATNELASNRDLTPIWPEGCRADQNFLRCGQAGLQGSLAMEGLGTGYSAALVKVFWLDGPSRVYTLTSAQPSVQLYGAADDKRGRGQIASAYLVLGVEHILSGFDHLLFVIGLLFLVGFNRRLLLTITAFTAAHSVTLALSALGLLTLRPPPVEATIALSIMLVAGEALRERQTLARRWPAMVAFLFGLVHGLGFAGALKEIGLPDNHLWVALLTFNVGVEMGQLLTVCAAWLVYRAVRQLPVWAPARLTTLYAIGTLAAYWSCARIVTVFS